MHAALVSPAGLALLVVDLLALIGGLLYPLFRHRTSDQGDGRNLVLLPRPRDVSPLRTASFIVMFVLLDVLYQSMDRADRIDRSYARVVANVAAVATHPSAAVARYLSTFTLGIRFLVAATLLSLALTAVASPARRTVLAAQVLWYLAAMVAVDALLLVAVAAFDLPSQFSIFAGHLIALGLGMVVLMRSLFANFALPRETAQRSAPRNRRSSDSIILVTASIAAAAVVATLYLLIVSRSAPQLRPVLLILLPLPFARVSGTLRTAFLHVLRWLGPRRPPDADSAPDLDVIIPAFNEEDVIVDTLEGIEAAAARYRGKVRVVLADDGSTDRTSLRARFTIEGFRAASGEVITVSHGGKSATLNAALARCRAEIVVRIDADTRVHEDCFANAVRWFTDQTIGIVQAMVIPKRGRSLFSKLRLFETIRIYGFTHRGIQMVDAVNAVPGMFSAYRRKPVVKLGGFTVGMNGEDADMTLNLSRMGYRTWLDDKVVIYEDVPHGYRDFRSQRIRWSRATIHVFARHSPFRAGLGAPKVWFSQTHLAINRLLVPLRVTAVFYVLALAAFQGSYRRGIVTFVVGYAILTVSSMIIVVALAARFGALRRIGWLALWAPYVVLLQIFSLEALLSIPTRPVRLPGRPAELVTAPVVH